MESSELAKPQRWFTAHRIAKLQGQVRWSFEAGVYLGLDARGRVQCRSHTRPDQALIIHDLGHVLLAPPGMVQFELAPVSSENPAAMQSFLLAQRRLGRVALDEVPDIDTSGLLCLSDSAGLVRRLTQQEPSLPPTLVGGLGEGEPCDLAVWDLDSPQLAGLSEDDACKLIMAGGAGACVREVWIAGERLV